MWYESMLSLSIAVSLVLSIYTFRRSRVPGASSMGLFMLLVAVYASAERLEMMNIPEVSILAARLRLSATALLAAVWLVFALTYTHSGARDEKFLRKVVLICIVPALTLILIWTNEWHGLVFGDESLQAIAVDSERTLLIVSQNGIWFWIYIVYSYLLTVGGAILIIWNAIYDSRLKRHWALALAGVVLLAAITVLLWVLRITALDYSPGIFVLAGAIYLWSAAQHPMMHMVLLGRNAVITSMEDAVIVLDWQQYIVDLNPSAVALFSSIQPLLHAPASALAANWPQLQRVLEHLDNRQTVTEIEHAEQDRTAYFEASLTPLYFHLGQFAGHFLMLRDITARKLAGLALETANLELEMRVATRTAELQRANARLAEMAVTEERLRIAREIHDGLGHHLMGLSIQLQAAAGFIPDEADDLSTIIERCRREVKAAIAESRRSISDLRQPAKEARPLVDLITELTSEFCSRLPCELRIHQRGLAAHLTSQQIHTIYRTVQEALTNIQKHAQGVQVVSITLNYNPEWRVVRVENNGISATPVGGAPALSSPAGILMLERYVASGHYGLAGLRERAEQLGGSLEAGPLADGGFFVELGLPGEEVQL
jgi:signal transduction histidine kinase